MSVIVREDQERVQVYQLTEGPLAGQTFYGAHRIVCTNPSCPCTDMLFMLRRHSDDQQSNRPEETWKIIIDVKNRTLPSEWTSSATAGDTRFAEAFVSHLSEAHWNVFYHDLLQQRGALLDDASALKSARFDFSDLEQSIENGSAMVFFDTVFPFGMPFDLEVHGTRVTLFDQYCLNSRCTCTKVVLSAFPPFSSVRSTGNKTIEPLFTVSHNYQTHTATVIDDSVADSPGAAVGGDADLFLRAPKTDLKQISALVKKRHRMMRKVYQNYQNYQNYRTGTDARDDDHHGGLAHSLTPPALSGSPPPQIGSGGFSQSDLPHGKVGRNQACPCGSGRKFKHCCGR
jgi:hypothetical protein